MPQPSHAADAERAYVQHELHGVVGSWPKIYAFPVMRFLSDVIRKTLGGINYERVPQKRFPEPVLDTEPYRAGVESLVELGIELGTGVGEYIEQYASECTPEQVWLIQQQYTSRLLSHVADYYGMSEAEYLLQHPECILVPMPMGSRGPVVRQN